MRSSAVRLGGTSGETESANPGPDFQIAIGLVVLVIVTRLPFRTSVFFNWDSANFGLALRHFDVTQHFPHPPGYFYYVHVGRVIDFFVGDANTSFVIEGIAFSALAVVALYYLGKTLYDRATGLFAALFLAFSVTFWSFGTVALAYVSLAFFSAATALFAYEIIFRRRDRLLHVSSVYTVASGFRPDLLLFLAPLWLASLHGQGLARVAMAGAVAVAGFLLWFLPTVWLSGGLAQYLATFAAYTSVDVMQRYSVLQNGTAALIVNVRDTASYLFYALYATTVALALGFLAGLARVARAKGKWRGLNAHHLFLVAWITPMALFYAWVHVGDPGYVFTMLPALLVLAARGAIATGEFVASRFARGIMVRYLAAGAVVAAVVVTNTAIYTLHPRLLTLQGVRRADGDISSKIGYVRENYAPGSVVLIAYDLYRHLNYYLPEYDAVWLDVFARGESERWLSPEVERIIITEERLRGLAGTIQEVEEIALPFGKMYSIPAGPRGRIVYGSEGISVE